MDGWMRMYIYIYIYIDVYGMYNMYVKEGGRERERERVIITMAYVLSVLHELFELLPMWRALAGRLQDPRFAQRVSSCFSRS